MNKKQVVFTVLGGFFITNAIVAEMIGSKLIYFFGDESTRLGFLGIRFIPPAFGIQAGRGVMVVLLSILLPHLIGFYLLSHRIGLIN